MKIIVDTGVWSLALRRKKVTGYKEIKVLESIIDSQSVCMLGPIRQELLSGIKEQSQFKLLKEILSYYDDFPIVTKDYELAAEFFNTCRSKGIHGSNTDFLICAVSKRNRFPIFTIDKDFERFAKHIQISLLKL